jgi:hypothetical protein
MIDNQFCDLEVYSKVTKKKNPKIWLEKIQKAKVLDMQLVIRRKDVEDKFYRICRQRL